MSKIEMMKRLSALAITMVVSGGALAALDQSVVDRNLRRLGKTVMQFKDSRVQVVIGYRYASTHLGQEWIFLDTYVSATGNKPIEVDREDVALFTPDGVRIQLPSQKKLAEGLPDIRRVMQEASITRDPLEGYFVGKIRYQRIGFHTIPGAAITRDSFSTSQDRLALGDLFFPAPAGGFKPGEYALEIKNKDVQVSLPFQMPPDDPKAPKDGKTLPW